MLLEFVYRAAIGPLAITADESATYTLSADTLDRIAHGESVVVYQYVMPRHPELGVFYTTTPHKEQNACPVNWMVRGLLRRCDDPLDFECVPFDESDLSHNIAAESVHYFP